VATALTVSPLTGEFVESDTIRSSNPPIPVTEQLVRYVLVAVTFVPVTKLVTLGDRVVVLMSVTVLFIVRVVLTVSVDVLVMVVVVPK